MFKSGNSQAVRLPKTFRFSSEEVEIFRRGDEVVLREAVPHLGPAFDLLCACPTTCWTIGTTSRRRAEKGFDAAVHARYGHLHLRSSHAPPGVLKRFESLARGEAVISAVTYGELCYGAEKSGARERALAILDELVTLIPIQSLSPAVGVAYGEIRAVLKVRGEVIGNNDLWIAAHARATDLTLVTNNEREFRRFPGLMVENWATEIPGP